LIGALGIIAGSVVVANAAPTIPDVDLRAPSNIVQSSRCLRVGLLS
jgi:hypothetical protein